MLPLNPAPVDCDLHPALPGLRSLLPFLADHWRESVVERAIHELDSISYPENAPLTARPDWRPEKGKAGASLADMQKHILDPLGTRIGILNCLYGVQLLFSEDMAAVFARALNDWISKEWLDRDPRLRASIIVPPQSTEFAVDEIERRAGDKRFVQVMLLVMGETMLGRRHHWPIYRAAEKHGLPVAIHAGSGYRHAVTPVGWPSYFSEDYASQAIAFQSQLASMLSEGVFQKHPNLKVIFLESGFTWLPPFMWRFSKYWKGARIEVPWIDEPPFDIVRRQVRFSLQPFDSPPTAADVEKLMDHMGSDRMLLFSSDYPHWQFDNLDVLPEGLPKAMIPRILFENARETYPRLQEALA